MESEPRVEIVESPGWKRRKAKWSADIDQAPSFATAFGRRLRQLREADGRTAEQVAQSAQLLGLPWHRPTVAAIEGGRRGVTAVELLLLPLVLRRPLPDLLPEGTTWLNEHLAASGSATRRLLSDDRSGHPGFGPGALYGAKLAPALRAGIERFMKKIPAGMLLEESEEMEKYQVTEVERKAARRLGRTVMEVSLAAFRTFGRSLAEERDARLGGEERGTARARQAARGHVTRRLLAELQPALAAIPVKEGTDDGAR